MFHHGNGVAAAEFAGRSGIEVQFISRMSQPDSINNR